MILLKYSNNKEKIGEDCSDRCIDLMFNKIQEELASIDAKSERNDNIIIFKRIVRNSTHSGQNNIEAFKILREGEIKIKRINSDKLSIHWSVNLDTLIFLSILLGFLSGVAIGIFGSMQIIFYLFFCFGAMLILFIIGFIQIKNRIDDLINKAV